MAGDLNLGFLKWLAPLVLVVVLAFFGYRFCNPKPMPTTTTGGNTNMAGSGVLPTISATLSLSNVGGKVQAAGLVPDAQTKQAILDKLKAIFAEDNFTANITVDARAKPAGWMSKFGDALTALKGAPGASVSLDGDSIKVGGLGGSALAGLIVKFSSLFGSGFNVSAAGAMDEKTAVADARQRALDALANLKPGFSAQELVNALNIEIINFASGSANIPKDSLELLGKSAAAVKQAPAGTVLEVGGHTDNSGGAAGNVSLSQRRAEAVRNYLVKQGASGDTLTAKGYGPGKPVAVNDTEEGRFKNRRIEFTVVK
ncbi:MAG: OmpA family protein [Pyrinomonadaceae bacterium]